MPASVILPIKLFKFSELKTTTKQKAGIVGMIHAKKTIVPLKNSLNRFPSAVR